MSNDFKIILQEFLNKHFKCRPLVCQHDDYFKVMRYDEIDWYCVLTRAEFICSNIKWQLRHEGDVVLGRNIIPSYRLRKKHDYIIIHFLTRDNLLPTNDLGLPSSYNGQPISDGYFYENKLVFRVHAYCSKDNGMVTLR